MSQYMGQYIIGGWSQSLSAKVPPTFTNTIYGMVTNLNHLSTGPVTTPPDGWSPASRSAPNVPGAMWSYGGGGAGPKDMPKSQQDIDAILKATETRNWRGVDFDDESDMNVDNIIKTMNQLLPNLQKSYTFIAGHNYNNPESSANGAAINEAVRSIAQTNLCDRFCLMCYAASMWTMDEIRLNVDQAVRRTINNGVNPKQVILALTYRGLNDENLDFFLNTVKSNDIAGLFIWEFRKLDPKYLKKIESSLNIGMPMV